LKLRWSFIASIVLAAAAIVVWYLNGSGSYAGQLEYWVFGLALAALIPLAQTVNDITEGLSPYLGKVSRGLIEATFSNIPEIAIGVFLLIKAHESASLLDTNFIIIRGLLIGSVINNVLLGFRVISHPLQLMFTDGAILAGMLYVYLPLMVLPLYASMEKLDFRLIEAGYDLYANRFQVLRRVIVPLVKPGIIAGSILVFIPSLGAYVTPRALGGGKNMMLGHLIELQFGQGRNWPLGSAPSMTLLATVMAALLVYVRFAAKSDATGHG